jgi:hypothetical protein
MEKIKSDGSIEYSYTYEVKGKTKKGTEEISPESIAAALAS